MSARASWLRAIWHLLVWLVALSFLVPIGTVALILVQLASHASDPLTQITIFFSILILGALAALLATSVVAGVFALKGRPVVALVALPVVSAILIPAAFWPGFTSEPYNWQIALPGAVAFVATLLGLPQLRHADRRLAVLVAALLAVPVLTLGGYRASVAVYLAQQCPAGPDIDLTLTGPESGHFSTACGLPLTSTQELTGCRNGGDATVGFRTWDTIWFLEFQAGRAGTVTSDKAASGPYLFVGGNKTYGGPEGWHGHYVVDRPCSGFVDADLYSPGHGTVHVKGRWETPLV